MMEAGSQKSRASWPSRDDDGLFYLLLLIALLAVAGCLAWISAHALVSTLMIDFLHREIAVLDYVTDRFQTFDRQMLATDPDQVTLRGLYLALHIVALYLRLPAVVVMGVLAVCCILRAPPERFRRRFDLDGLFTEHVARFPAAAAFRRRHLALTKLPDGPIRPADYALTAEEWLDRFVAGAGQPFDAARARTALRTHLGPRWNGPRQASPLARFLFTAFALHHAERREDAAQLLASASLALDDGEHDKPEGPPAPLSLPESVLALAESFLKEPGWFTESAALAAGHGFETTALMTVLNAARTKAGVLPPAQFAWLKLIDRRLWYALQSLGFESPGMGLYLHPNARTEAIGARAHWARERMIGRALFRPELDEALAALAAIHDRRSGRVRPRDHGGKDGSKNAANGGPAKPKESTGDVASGRKESTPSAEPAKAPTDEPAKAPSAEPAKPGVGPSP
jgi:intracellular multiplication protein IcmP